MKQAKYVSDYLERNAVALKDEKFLICQDKTVSWTEAYQKSQIVSAFISKRLDGKQQRIVSILLPDSWQFVVSYFGIVGSGNIAMPVDITFKKLEVDFVLKAAGPDIIIATKETMGLTDRPVVLVEDILASSLKPHKISYALPPDQQVATLFLSSGTTGQPKAIPNTHTNQIWDVEAIAGPMGWTSKDTLLITLHLAHRHGLVICLLGALHHGNSVYLHERFNPDRVIKMLESGKISFYSTVPAAYEKLIEFEPRKTFDFSKVRLFASSSSPLPPYLAQAFRKRFGRDILDRYGTSETGSIAIKQVGGTDTFGELVPGVKIRIEDSGEVALKSPGLFPGYLNNPGSTKKNMTKDGWWLTGDIGQMQGRKLVLKGRSKERINKGGYSIYPQDIEWAIKQNKKIAEIKITSVHNQRQLDDKVIAFFTGTLSDLELSDYCQANLPKSWRPDIFIKLPAIPKTANGKASLIKLNKLLLSEYEHLV